MTVASLLLLPLVVSVVAADGSFESCFCWNHTAGGLCDGFAEGSSWTTPCQNRLLGAFYWASPAIFVFCFFLFFPFFFCLSRVLCNCCGGRHPSEGCCCPDQSSRHRFAGYTNVTLFLAKLFFCASLA